MDNTENKSLKKLSDFFQHLTPQVLNKDDKASENIQALKYAIEEASIKNIALTGSYGSGKSSILKTLEDRHPEHHYLRISLASFNDPELPKLSTSTKSTSEVQSKSEDPKDFEKTVAECREYQEQENLERLLELSILQQMFYHVEHDKIPDSRFKRIKSLGQDTILNFQIASIIWIISTWYLFFPDSLDFKTVHFFNEDLLKIIALVLFFVGLAKLLSHFRRIYNNSKINKLNIQSGEVEIDKEVEQSILNKHIDEIIYFFEVTPYDVVMIEDLDRFDNTAIFSKLREINLLINNSEQVNRTINFIYAVRDDIFTDSHRTKFFDFFIPVIPVSDPSNATDLLTQSFKKLDREVPKEEFLSDVASFIPDMRFLNNVFNEYLLYESNIKATLNPEKRLAIILYKNLYPKDFILLQKGTGMLFEVLRSRNKLVQVVTKEVNEEINRINNKLSALKEDLLLKEKELRSIYINAIQSSVANSIGIKIEESFRGFGDLRDEETFNKIPKEEPILHRCMDGPNRSHSHFRDVNGKSLAAIEIAVNPNLTYEERLQQTRNKATSNKYLQELATQKTELNRLRHLNLGQLLSKTADSKNFGAFEKDELITYFLKKGYIDENYSSYISHFYEGQITSTDHKFYQHVIAETASPFDFQLVKTTNLIRKLAPRFFLRESILNLNLVDELIENKHEFKVRYDLFFQQVINKSEQSKEFILYYAEHGKFPEKFLAEVYYGWSAVWDLLCNQTNIEKDRRDEYLLQLLQEVEIDTLVKTISTNGIEAYLLSDPEILILLQKVPAPKIQKLISETPIKFSELNYSKEKEIQSILKFVFTSGHWKFTDFMVLTACRLFNDPLISQKKVNESPYSLLRAVEELSSVIKNNLNQFVEEILLEKNHLKETPIAFLELLNNSDIPFDYKKNIIRLQDPFSKIQKIQEVEDQEVQNLLLEFGKVEATWVNVFDYYNEHKKITTSLSSFLNSFSELLILDESKISGEEIFKKQVLLCNDIQLESFKVLIPFFFKEEYNEMDFENLSAEKVDFLIKEGVLVMNPDIFKYLKEHFEGLQIGLAKKYPKTFISKLSLLTLDASDLNQLLASEDLDEDFKYELISGYSDSISELNEDASQVLIDILLNKSTLGIKSAAIHHLIWSAKNEQTAIKFLLKYEEELSEENLRKAVQMLPAKFHKVLKKRKRLELPLSDQYTQLGKLLDRHNIATLKIKSQTLVITGSYK